MTDKNNNSGNHSGAQPQQPAPAPPKIGKPYMDHRVLTREIKADTTKTVRPA